jgi:hypothetical protein
MAGASYQKYIRRAPLKNDSFFGKYPRRIPGVRLFRNSFVFTGRSKWMQNAEQEARQHSRTLSTSRIPGFVVTKLCAIFNGLTPGCMPGV